MTDTSGENIVQLVGDLSSENATDRMKAREALVAIGPAAVPALINALGASEQHVRWEAAKALAEIADPAATEKLVATLGDEHRDVRWVAGEALIALGPDVVKPVLAAVIKSDVPGGVYEGAHHVLHELAKRGKLASLLAPVLKAFKQPQPELSVPVAAENAIENI